MPHHHSPYDPCPSKFIVTVAFLERMPRIGRKQTATGFFDKPACNLKIFEAHLCLKSSRFRYVLLKSQVEGTFIKIAGCVSFVHDDYGKPSNMSSTFTTSWSLYLNRILGMQEHPAPHCSHITTDKIQHLPRFFICNARRTPEKKQGHV